MTFREQKFQRDIVVVGAGPAGCAAAVQLRRLGLKVMLIDRTGTAGGLAVNARKIENYPGLERPISGMEYSERLREFLERFGIVVRRAEVQRVRVLNDGRGGVSIILKNSRESVSFLSAVLAVGTEPKKFVKKGISKLLNRRVFYHISEACPKTGERIAIVGGGEAAFDYALSAADAGSWVTLLIRGERPRATGELAAELYRNRNIEIFLHTELIEIFELENNRERRGETLEEERKILPERLELEERQIETLQDTKLALKLKNREGSFYLYSDKVIVAIGRESALGKVLNFELKNYSHFEKGSYLVPLSHFQAPGIFICGDCRFGSLGQTATAAGDGLFAAKLAFEYVQSIRKSLR